MFSKIDFQNIINNYDMDVISKIDIDNALLIYYFLLDNDIYYADDILLGYIDLFFYPFDEFKSKYNNLTKHLGEYYLDKLENDIGLFQLIHQF